MISKNTSVHPAQVVDSRKTAKKNRCSCITLLVRALLFIAGVTCFLLGSLLQGFHSPIPDLVYLGVGLNMSSLTFFTFFFQNSVNKRISTTYSSTDAQVERKNLDPPGLTVEQPALNADSVGLGSSTALDAADKMRKSGLPSSDRDLANSVAVHEHPLTHRKDPISQHSKEHPMKSSLPRVVKGKKSSPSDQKNARLRSRTDNPGKSKNIPPQSRPRFVVRSRGNNYFGPQLFLN